MYIDRVKLLNIGLIEALTIDFHPHYAGWNVLIGDNGSGKSTFIKAVSLALIGPIEAHAIRADWNEWLRKGEAFGSTCVFITTDKEIDENTGKSKTNIEELDLICNAILFIDTDKKVILRDNYNFEIGDANLKSIKHPDKENNYNWGTGKGWFSAGFGSFRRFTGGNPELDKVYLSSPKVGAHLSVFDEGAALTEVLAWIKSLDYKRLKEKEYGLEESESGIILDNIKHFVNKSGLLPNGVRFEKVDELPIFKDASGNNFPVTQLSDGFRSILSLTFELIRQLIITFGHEPVFKDLAATNQIKLPGVVLIDEVDAHLHPSWQTKIGGWFTQHFPDLQFIVTTHSPLICRACDKGSIWRLEAANGAVVINEITGTEKEKLIYGNILDAYGTELFGKEAVRSAKSAEKLERLGRLNVLSALGKITNEEENERHELLQILSTDDSIAN